MRWGLVQFLGDPALANRRRRRNNARVSSAARQGPNTQQKISRIRVGRRCLDGGCGGDRFRGGSRRLSNRVSGLSTLGVGILRRPACWPSCSRCRWRISGIRAPPAISEATHSSVGSPTSPDHDGPAAPAPTQPTTGPAAQTPASSCEGLRDQRTRSRLEILLFSRVRHLKKYTERTF